MDGNPPARAVRTAPIVVLDEGEQGLGPGRLAVPRPAVLPLPRERPAHALDLSVLPGAVGGARLWRTPRPASSELSSRPRYPGPLSVISRSTRTPMAARRRPARQPAARRRRCGCGRRRRHGETPSQPRHRAGRRGASPPAALQFEPALGPALYLFSDKKEIRLVPAPRGRWPTAPDGLSALPLAKARGVLPPGTARRGRRLIETCRGSPMAP